MNDFQYQAEYVARQSWRLLSMQDRSRLSPSYGCFHLAYWRDKTSEFADARFQEAGATLGLLSLPAFDSLRAATSAPSAPDLYESFAAAALQWSKQQYADGAFDEWYKGERGFAAAEFTVIAFGLALLMMEGHVQPRERDLIVQTIGKSARWLRHRHDRVKTNHEMAAAAALAIAWKVTGKSDFMAAAREKFVDAVARQTEEGWFPEIGGMDLGYCSVLLDYAMLYYRYTEDAEVLPAMAKLLSFMLSHVHPDLTISPEAGTCLNPYVSRLGMRLLAPHDPQSAALVDTLGSFSPGLDGLTPYLSDDLRLSRWSYLPLATALVGSQSSPALPDKAAVGPRYPQGWTLRKHAAIAAYHSGDTHIFFCPVGGGMVRVYRGQKLLLEDGGVAIEAEGDKWGMVGYDPDRPLSINGQSCGFEGKLFRVRYFFPGLLPRLVLRIGCMVPQGAYFLRAMIDRQRLKKKSAFNQSAAPVAQTDEGYQFERQIDVAAGKIEIIDRIRASAGAPRQADLTMLIRHLGGPAHSLELPRIFTTLVLRKTLNLAGNSTLRIGIESA